MILDLSVKRDLVLPYARQGEFIVLDRRKNLSYTFIPENIRRFVKDRFGRLVIVCNDSQLVLPVHSAKRLQRYLTVFFFKSYWFSPN